MYISIDIETQGLEINTEIHFIGVYTINSTGKELFKMFKIPEDTQDFKDFVHKFKDKTKWIFHNGKFDTARILWSLGIDIPINHDTMILCYLLSTVDELKNNRNKWLGLKYAASRILGVPNWDVPKDVKTSKDADKIKPYLYQDCSQTYALFMKTRQMLPKERRKTYALIMMALNCYKYIELNGLPIDLNQLKVIREDYMKNKIDVDNELNKFAEQYDMPNINYNSPIQLQKLLFEKIQLPIINYTNTGQPSTGVHELKELHDAHPIIDFLLKKREIEKALGFLNDWEEKAIQHDDGNYYLHPNFNMHGTVTGRTSCNSPNLQQIPRNKKLKSLFKSCDEEWEMVCVDYSQLELRTASIVANIKAMKESYRNGVDLHKLIASRVNNCDISEVTKEQRTAAKAINFGFLYGMQAPSFVDYAKDSYGTIFTLAEATHIRDVFFETYPELLDYYQDVEEKILTDCKYTSIMGREYEFNPDVLINKTQRSNYIRASYNFPVQSAGSDYVICGLIAVANHPKLKHKFRIGATVHDSIIGLLKKDEEFYDNIELIKTLMQQPPLVPSYIRTEVDIPIIVDEEIGPLGKGVSVKEYKTKEKENE